MPIFGYKDSKGLKYIKYRMSEIDEIEDTEIKKKFIKKYEDVFSGIGTFPDKVQIKLKEGSVPIANSPKRVPIKLLNKF